MPRTEKSRKIFEYFAKLGKSEGFEVYYSNNPSEYLLDMCWVYISEKLRLNWIEVAFEIELSKKLDAITDEFAKLVDIKAYTKVLLCTPKVDDVGDLIRQASELIRYNPLRFYEERYLFIAITGTRKRFILNGFVLDSLGNTIALFPSEFPK
jgi:hypothetical protein